MEEEEGDEEVLKQLLRANEEIDKVQKSVYDPKEKEQLRQQVGEILRRLEKEIEANKFDGTGKTKGEVALSKADREFVEQVDKEYYKRVNNSEEYYQRKKLILRNLDRLQRKVEKSAKHFDDYERLRFVMLQKAKQKKSILRNFLKLEQFGEKEEERK